MDFFPTTTFGWVTVLATIAAPAFAWYQHTRVMAKLTPKYKYHFTYGKEMIVAEIYLKRMKIPYYLTEISLISEDECHIICYNISSKNNGDTCNEKQIEFKGKKAINLNYLIQSLSKNDKDIIK
ncbi:MAG: hypothetical protein IJ150_10245, partial [Bacteroidales bacterium]|nr:hypothetical protein [Bacteroidales bacterium]